MEIGHGITCFSGLGGHRLLVRLTSTNTGVMDEVSGAWVGLEWLRIARQVRFWGQRDPWTYKGHLGVQRRLHYYNKIKLFFKYLTSIIIATHGERQRRHSYRGH